MRFSKSLLLGLVLLCAAGSAPLADKDTADAFRVTTDKRAGYDWWALQPLKTVRPPALKIDGRVRNPIDAFILAALEERGLVPSPEADKRTLIRRVTFDLTGLPPTAEQVTAFLKDDSPDAYEKLVDRLLGSPDYGVHWARHWLDVARFGESDGFERDQYRPNAWRYRDWLVDAFNSDLPYDRFARMQIAGNLIEPQLPDGMIATQFLVCGARDVVGETQQSAAMKSVVRQDQLEDIVGTVSQTFLGLTANCARCHNHKFDPISQREYYQLASALSGVHAGERSIPADAARAAAQLHNPTYEQRLSELQTKLDELQKSTRQRLEAALTKDGGKQKAPPPIAEWRFDEDLRDHVGSLDATLKGIAIQAGDGLRLAGDGYASTPPLQISLREKTLEAWVSLHDLQQAGGGVISIQTLEGSRFDAIVFGEREPARWMAGSDGFQRTKSFYGPPEKESAKFIQIAITWQADGTITAYRNGQQYGSAYKCADPQSFSAGKAQVLFGLRHFPAEGNKFLSGSIQRAKLYNRALSAAEIAASAGVKPGVNDSQVAAALSKDDHAIRDIYLNEIAQIHRQQARDVTTQIFTCVPTASPGISKLLIRGNTTTEGETVSPAGIAAVAGLDADFGLAPDAPDNKRREKLAAWITDARNPLFARVIVNRLWLYHFGDGIVETPNDFGFNGGRPSNPQLLDWLANQMQAGGWSIKKMQRLIVTSATYRQSSLPRANAMLADASNRHLWRMKPRRIEAESLRDAILQVCGQLNPQIGGPGYEDYYTFTNNTTFYEARDYIGAAFNRRSLYRTWIRSGRNPILDVFDCPDPSTKTPRRALTTTPLQALALMNDSFIFRMSDSLADVVKHDAGEDVSKQLTDVYARMLCRVPSVEEVEDGKSFISKHGLAAFCRVMLNSSEFVTVD